MKTVCDRNARARKVSVGVIRDPRRFATAPNDSRQTYSRGKGEFRTCSLKVEEPAGMALPTCEISQDPGLWLVRPESSCFPSKCLTNALENSLHCINEGRGFCQDFRHRKVDHLPVLRAFAFGDIIVCFQNVRAVSLRIAVQRPPREHGHASAIAPRVN